jgi:hypothetical protein
MRRVWTRPAHSWSGIASSLYLCYAPFTLPALLVHGVLAHEEISRLMPAATWYIA